MNIQNSKEEIIRSHLLSFSPQGKILLANRTEASGPFLKHRRCKFQFSFLCFIKYVSYLSSFVYAIRRFQKKIAKKLTKMKFSQSMESENPLIPLLPNLSTLQVETPLAFLAQELSQRFYSNETHVYNLSSRNN